MGSAREVPAGKFKDGCLALLDEVAASGVSIVVTKRGRPVAKVVPIEPPPSLEGSVRYDSEANLIEPLTQAWEAEA